MAERTFGTQVAQIGKETTKGTAVAALKRLLSLSFDIGIELVLNRFRPSGYRRATRNDPGKNSASFSGNGKPSYSNFPFIFNSLYEKVTPTTPGGGTNSRDWTYQQSSTVVENTDTYTIEKGSPQGAERVVGAFFSGYEMTGSPDAIDLTAEGMGRSIEYSGIALSTPEIQTVDLSGGDDPTGGTWTLTILGTTLTGLAWNITASALQTLINALTANGAPDVTVSTSGFVYTITFPAYLGDVTAVTANGAGLTTAGSITITIATTQPGVAATEVEDRQILPEHVKWYADSASGSLGGTLLLRVFEWAIRDTGMRELFWTVNRANAGAAAGDVEAEEPTGEIELLMAADAAGMAFYTTAKQGDLVFLRFEAIDDTDAIETGFTYEAVFDYAARVSAIGKFENNQGIYALRYTFELNHSSSWGKALSLRVRNQLTTT